ncbi:MAG: hypothetical protein K6L81_06805 [Agarilytica sp.]
MKKLLLTLSLFISSQCFSHETPPELWSWIKDLDKSKAACEIQSAFVLKGLKLDSQKENKYGIYSTYKNNRIVIKCIEVATSKSKLIVAVAGNDRDAVALLRNKIVTSIN